jgi:dihydroorotase
MWFYITHPGQAIVSAVTSGNKKFFLGTDSAPHEKRRKECPCGCAGIYNAPVAISLYSKVFEEVSFCCIYFS